MFLKMRGFEENRWKIEKWEVEKLLSHSIKSEVFLNPSKFDSKFKKFMVKLKVFPKK